MGSRMTTLLIGILSVTGLSATTVAPADSTASAAQPLPADTTLVADSLAARPAQVTPFDSIQYQQEADKRLLSLMETDTTEQMLPVIKMLRMLEYADSIKAAQGSNEIPVNPLFLPIVFKEQMSTPLQHLPEADNNPFKPRSLTVNDQWLQREIEREKTREMAQNYVIVNYPKMIHYNLDNLPEVPKQYIIENDPVKHVLSIKEKPLIIKNDVGKEKIKLKRWVVNFQSAIQFSQVYVSENWYQGGTSNLNLIGSQTYTLNYKDYKDKIIFENKVQWNLNISSAPDDTLRNYSISEDLFRIDSKFGYKAFGNIYYSTSLYFKTQFFNNYKKNTDTRTASFLSPGELSYNLGMSHNYTSKNKAFTSSASVSPFSYNLKTCIDEKMDPTKYGIEEGKKILHQFGSSFDATVKWEFMRNMYISSRIYYFTSYKHVQVDFENTFNFILNRYFSTKLEFKMRYDDSAEPNERGSFLQIKEMLSFGLFFRI